MSCADIIGLVGSQARGRGGGSLASAALGRRHVALLLLQLKLVVVGVVLRFLPPASARDKTADAHVALPLSLALPFSLGIGVVRGLDERVIAIVLALTLIAVVGGSIGIGIALVDFDFIARQPAPSTLLRYNAERTRELTSRASRSSNGAE